MTVCTQCKKTWSIWQAYTFLFSFNRKKTCLYCGHCQYISLITRKKLSALFIAPLILEFPLFVFDFPLLINISFLMLSVFAVQLFVAFSLRLSAEEEPLW
jgi:CXXC-20-CXXC protein